MIATTSIVAGRLQRRLENKKGQPQSANPLEFNGSPKGNRTPVFAVRGRYPRPLDDGTVDKIAARFYITRLPPLSNEKVVMKKWLGDEDSNLG